MLRLRARKAKKTTGQNLVPWEREVCLFQHIQRAISYRLQQFKELVPLQQFGLFQSYLAMIVQVYSISPAFLSGHTLLSVWLRDAFHHRFPAGARLCAHQQHSSHPHGC